MHVHIPSVSDATDAKGNRYKVFDIYINGIYHCSLRYSQLLDLHNEVKSKYCLDAIVDFPPKIIRISDIELDWRRRQLERYLHCLCQDRQIGESELLMDYLLTTQKVCSGVPESSAIQLEVFLCNGKSKEFTSSSHSRTSHILVAACEAIGIEKEFACYFGLFIEFTKKNEDDWKLLKYCTDLECPYLSVRNATRNEDFNFRLSIRKWFFNKLYTSKLLESKTCLNMLYVEGMAIVEGERRNEIPKEELDSLLALTKSRKQFVEKLNEIPLSNEIICSELTIGEHKKNCVVRISGKYILVSEQFPDRKGKIYPISKLRCWKVGVTRNSKDHFFAFEYEYQQQKFMWVTLRGWSTILLTQCIGRAVEEYILIANNKKPSLVLASEVPSIKNQFSPPTFVSGLPNGIDINMVKYAASEDSTSDEESCDLEQDDVLTNSTDQNNDDTVDQNSHDTDHVGHSDTKKQSVAVETVSDSPTPRSSSGHTSYKKQTKSKKSKQSAKKDSIVFNDTFLDDSDL